MRANPRAGALLATMACTLLLGAADAMAQAWPSRPLRLVAPFAPGGTTDTLSRLVAQKLSDAYRQPVIAENRPGAGGVIGSELVARATPDGYLLLISSLASQVIAPVVQKTPYETLRDFTHLAILGGPPTAMGVGPALPEVRDIAGLVALAKAKPGALSYGTPGSGTHGHIIAALFAQLAGVQLSHVPYKGSGPAVADLVAGHVQLGPLTIAVLGPQLRAGKVRALATTASRRIPTMPEVPTFTELGYPDLTGITWFGVAGPAKLPDSVAESLNREIRRAMQAPDTRERLQPEGFEFPDLDLARTTEYVAAEARRWQPVARASAAKND
jgi:tripartite-type tricarboxylate transporter receptor subunit TctC